ncbi:MAG: hypothetical protein P1U49_01250 [Minwuia sp.]|nr:hypothetical protein [Minwuia sp.]
MYYLLIAAAAGMSVPADNSPIATIDVTSSPASVLTAYDTRRIQYKARTWEGELKSNVDIYFGTFDSEEACKAVRAQIRSTLGNQEDATRSGCFESRDNAGATDS